MNMTQFNNSQANMVMNSYINQPTICQIKKKKNTTSKKNSHKNQTLATSFVEQFPMQMPIQQQMQFQNQQFISQPYNKSMKASYQSQIDALVSINNKRRLHPKSKFTPQEDQKLRDLVSRYGENDWVTISKMMGTRNQRQCRERWTNYLSPNICFAPWSSQEDELLKKLHEEIGAKWVKIASYFPNRTDTNIKNRWMVLQRQKKAAENSKKYKKDSYKQDEFNSNEGQVLQVPSENQEQIKEDPLLLNFEADTQIDLMDDITSSNLLSSEYMFDFSWM